MPLTHLHGLFYQNSLDWSISSSRMSGYFVLLLYFIEIRYLTLKTPRKPASENVVCLCCLLNVLANLQTYFCIQANSVDPDQTAPRGAV